jgi:hypothetical protein
MGKTFKYIQLQPPHQSDPDQLCCCFALRHKYLVFLYQLKAFNLKPTLSK